jgi:hypothetical protein
MGDMVARIAFGLGGLYDFGLGVIFVLFGPAIYRYEAMTPPNHPAYIQFPALTMMIAGAMFFQVAKNPRANRSIMLYGVALKSSFISVVSWHALHHDMPATWFPYAWIDLVFLILFVTSWWLTGRPTNE